MNGASTKLDRSGVLGKSLTSSLRLSIFDVRTALVFAILAAPCAARAQAVTNQAGSQYQQIPSDFEVASVKRNTNTPSGRTTFHVSAGGRLTADNMSLRLLIQHAYDVRPFQISGGPSWMETERYDIAAKADGAVPEKQVVGPMLRALLENRFGLKLHHEMKEMPVFNLTQTDGAKLPASNDADCNDAAPLVSPAGSAPLPCHKVVFLLSATGVRLRGKQVNTGQLVVSLASILGRPVIDRTAFTGKFDLDMEVSMEGLEGGILGSLGNQTPDIMAPPIFTALPKLLGLKLTATKGPVEVLVIEHAERPSEN